MDSPDKLRDDLALLQEKRAALVRSGWCLQRCWLVQVKPGGTARTDRYYWQLRSRQPFLTGKTLKHLKADEVEMYRAAIDRGRQLQQLDRQIEQLQRRLARLSTPAAPQLPSAQTSATALVSPIPDHSSLAQARPVRLPKADENPEQFSPENAISKSAISESAISESAINDLSLKNQELRDLLRQTMSQWQNLATQNSQLRRQTHSTVSRSQARRQASHCQEKG